MRNKNDQNIPHLLYNINILLTSFS